MKNNKLIKISILSLSVAILFCLTACKKDTAQTENTSASEAADDEYVSFDHETTEEVVAPKLEDSAESATGVFEEHATNPTVGF